jgi:hypothetical protein
MVVHPTGEVTVDYTSVVSGPLTDPADDTRTLPLSRVIELISVDLETVAEDPRYGVASVVGPFDEAIRDAVDRRHDDLRETVGTAAGILASIGAKLLGLG